MSPEEITQMLVAAGATKIINRGRNIHACCPFHDEQNPSFGISVEEPHFFGCFGCGQKGTAMTILISKLGMSVRAATKFLKLREKAEANLPSLKKIAYAVRDLPEETLYPYWLHSKARRYLYSRGIKLRTMIQAKLLYAPEFNRVLFPWRWQGKLHTVTGRTLSRKTKAEAKTIPLFETKKSSTLYLPTGCITKGPFALVEGEIDALAVFQNALKNVGALGHGAFARKQIAQIAESPCSEVILFFDNDPTGLRLTAEAIRLLGASKTVSLAVYPKTKFSAKSDPASLSSEALRVAIKYRKRRIQWDLETLTL